MFRREYYREGWVDYTTSITENDRYCTADALQALLPRSIQYEIPLPFTYIVSPEEVDHFYEDPYPCEEGELSGIEELL